MMKIRVERYTRKRIKRLGRLLRSYLKSDDPEILHQVRIEIKKIKAVLHLLHFNHKKFDDHRAFLAFRDIFRACGKIREPYVMQSLTIKLTGEPMTSDHGDPSLIARFRKKIPKYLRTLRKQGKKLRAEAKKVKPRIYRKYLKKQNQLLASSLFPKFKSAELHSDRKLIKEILYLNTIMQAQKDSDPFLTQCADLIGQWHDYRVLLDHLADTGTAAPQLISKLRKESNTKLKEITAWIQAYYTNKNVAE